MDQVRELAIHSTILGGMGQAGLDFKEVAGAAAEGVTVVAHYDPAFVKSEKASKFAELWAARYKREPDYLAASGYDAVWMIADAAKKVGASRKEVTRELSTMEFNGASGKVKLLPLEELRKDIVLQRWESGRLVGKENLGWIK